MKHFLEELCIAALAWIPTAAGMGARLLLWRPLFKRCGRARFGTGIAMQGCKNMSLADGVRIGRGCQLYAEGGTLDMGEDAALSPGVTVDASGGLIRIGKQVAIGPGTVLRAANHCFDSLEKPIMLQGHLYGEIVIEDDVWIAANCTITPGTRIGHGAVVGAGAVVTRDVEPYAIVGAPHAGTAFPIQPKGCFAMKIAITTSSFARYSDEPLKLLEQAGVEYVMNDKGRALTEEEAIQILEGCHGVAAGTEPLTKKVMDALPDLKVISRCGTGMDNVDRAYAAEKGIEVRNTPDGPTLAVAELTLGLILTLLRQVPHQDRELRSGVWKKRMGNLLHGKNVGIVGFGKIGQAVAHLLEPFGVNVGYHDPFADVPGYTRLELDDLMGWADVITLHCPKTENGAPLLDLGRLSLMRPGSIILNIARGGLIDEKALLGLLTAGHLAGAALDCFTKEPYDGPLKEMDNVILTPHIGSYAKEARIIMETDTIKNLLDVLFPGA